VLGVRSNIESVAREICTRLYARHWPRDPELDADVDRHWHIIVTAQLEASLIDETGADRVVYHLDREMAALRDWRARHPTTSSRHGYPGPRAEPSHHGTRRLVTCIDTVAEPRSKVAGEMFLAMTRTVLLDQAAASSSMKRVYEDSAA
jgi:hypothetical protein